jgi:murein L,D-transpeptidase YcbB/YkuD
MNTKCKYIESPVELLTDFVKRQQAFRFGWLCFLLFMVASCGSNQQMPDELAHDEHGLNREVMEAISDRIREADSTQPLTINDRLLDHSTVVRSFYQQNQFLPIWSDTGSFRPYGVALFDYLDTCIRDGLVSSQYHYETLKSLRKICEADKEEDPAQWAAADLLMTDAFMHILSDLKIGRLLPDSALWKKDPAKINSFYIPALLDVKKAGSMTGVLQKQHPIHADYQHLRNALKSFTDSMDTRTFTMVTYPYEKGDQDDSLAFVRALYKRLSEEQLCTYDKNNLPDSLALASLIKQYQAKRSIKSDGKIAASLIKKMNLTDMMRLKRIMVTLDRYKLEDQSMPDRYLMVNLPGFYLKVFDSDTLALYSKIICGTSATKTPLLKSEINEIVTYPTWTVPSGIIKNELLPGLKRNSSYLSRRGLALYTSDGKRISASSVNWSKYSNGIPFRVRQASGDNNALGVMKFNFDNPYSVYLHDTNKRGLFDRDHRALSHGCVRVQNWKGLADYLVQSDSIHFRDKDKLAYTLDSVNRWLDAKKHKKLPVANKLPIFIQYFSCEAKGRNVFFYDDIYDDDKKLLQQYASRF